MRGQDGAGAATKGEGDTRASEGGVQLQRVFEALARVPDSSYLVSPINAAMKLTESEHPAPRLHVDVDVSRVRFALNRGQAGDLLRVAQRLATIQRNKAFLRYRPALPCAARNRNVASWWRYGLHWARWQQPSANRPGMRAIADPARCTPRRMGYLWCTRARYMQLYKRLRSSGTLAKPLTPGCTVRAPDVRVNISQC